MRAIPTASTGSSPPCPPTPAPASGSWPQRRSRTTPSGSTAPPPRRAAPNSDHQAADPLSHTLAVTVSGGAATGAAGGGPELDPDELWLRYRQGSRYSYVAP